MESRKIARGEAGFTLTEIMIVIAIIGIIMGFVGSKVIQQFNEAKVNSTKIQMRQLAVVMDDFYRVCGFYPATEQGLDALVKKPDGKECKNYPQEGFLSNGKIPPDGFGNAFLYTSDGSKFSLKSMGKDNREGGTGPDQDVTSEDL